jgi:hypothetical protein
MLKAKMEKGMTKRNEKRIFVIDTDSYSGNFEREMCAYLTGIVGDCEVGDKFAKLYVQETGDKSDQFGEYVEQRPDDHGCYRPCYIWTTKGWLSDGGDGAIREEDWNQKKANENYRKSTAAIYQGYYNQIAKMDLNDPAVQKAGWDKKSKEKELKQHKKDIERCLKSKCPKYPPYNSVAIFFERKPTEKMIVLMKRRAEKFAEAKRNMGNSWDKNFKLKIYGFRLIKETTKSEEEKI